MQNIPVETFHAASVNVKEASTIVGVLFRKCYMTPIPGISTSHVLILIQSYIYKHYIDIIVLKWKIEEF